MGTTLQHKLRLHNTSLYKNKSTQNTKMHLTNIKMKEVIKSLSYLEAV